MKGSLAFAITLLGAAQYAAAHGYVKTITIAGKPFEANFPFGDQQPSGIRKVSDVTPIKGAKNHDIQCGINAKAASQVLAANPGDKVTFDWRGADGSFWPHDTGPWLTWLASCGNTTCDKFNADTGKFFKIEQAGQKTEGGGEWFQKDLMSGAVATVKLPGNIAPGQYILRHEIIALHLADQMGGAEFYSTCVQLSIGGNGNGAPSPNELVSIPGVYTDNDPGIFTPNVFNPGFKYKFPGPAISTLAATGNGNSNGTTAKPPPKPKPAQNNSVCRLRRSAKAKSSSSLRRRLPRLLQWDLGTGSNRH